MILSLLSPMPQIGLVRSLASGSLPSVTSYYLGFYIHSCVKMRYKGRYSPSFLACPETFSWQPLAACVPLLDQSSYSRLDPDSGARDPEAGGDISEVGVLFLRQVGIKCVLVCQSCSFIPLRPPYLDSTGGLWKKMVKRKMMKKRRYKKSHRAVNSSAQ